MAMHNTVTQAPPAVRPEVSKGPHEPTPVRTELAEVQRAQTAPLEFIVARSFFARLGGLLALPRLREGQALVLAPCNSVHTLFMRYAIDVAFVDKQGRVMKLVEGLQPWRAASCWRAQATVELAAGQARAHGLAAGVQLDPDFLYSLTD
jgi:uncharacterized protein